MRRAARSALSLAAACLLAGAAAAGCTGPTAHNTGVTYTCCADSVVSTRWHPGQQLRIEWTRVGPPQPGQAPQTLTLTAVLTGPFSGVAALKAAVSKKRRGEVTVAAPEIRISRNPPRSVVSVISIPADAPAGLYNLETGLLFQGGGSVVGGTVVTVG